MEPVQARPWYKKKRYLVPLGLGAVALALSSGGPSSPSSTASQADLPAAIETATLPPVDETTSRPVTQPAPPSTLSNDDYYTNVDGNKVHSPAYSDSIPAGASARCRDGTYSFSQHRSGTCSHHGGVSTWY